MRVTCGVWDLGIHNWSLGLGPGWPDSLFSAGGGQSSVEAWFSTALEY